jgi:DNA (cytosine-5)-methyltransferase 1
MKFISLFSGIGGFDLGFEQAGMTPVLQVENDKNCLALLNQKWPDVPKMEDVRDVTRENSPTTNLVCGGFPCQDVSVAGGRAGLAGERSGLWFEFRRIIEEVRPQWVVIENVPGLLSGALAKFGYWWAYRVLDAQYFGVPQRRRRVFIVGCLTRGCAQKVLFERESCPWDTPPGRETGAELAAAAIRLAQTGSNGWGVKTDGTIGTLDQTGDDAVAFNAGNSGINQVPTIAFGGNNTSGPVSVATACNAHESGRYDFESETFICNTFNDYTCGADDNDAQDNHLVIGFDSSRAQHTGDIAAPLRVNGAKSPGVNDGKPDNMCISGSSGVRRLTPIECERLQGFPDNFTTGQSDSVRYRQLGNAVAVPVAEWLGRRIFGLFPLEEIEEER